MTVCEKTLAGNTVSGLGSVIQERQYHYNVKGAANELAATAEMLAAYPVLYGGLVRRDWNLTYVGSNCWSGDITYTPFVPPSVGDETYGGTTSGGTVHITHALAQTKYPESAADHKGAIGLVSDGTNGYKIEGTDVEIPSLDFSVTKTLASGTINDSWVGALYALSKRVNSVPWRGYAAGEILFRGADFSGGNNGTQEQVTFNFSASPNLMSFSVGTITGINKLGWEHMEVNYAETVDGNQASVAPTAVYVSQIYYTADLALLGV